MDISVVIPIYGCRAALEELHRRLTDTLVAMDKEYEIILVNDNCPQNSWEVIQQLCKKDKHVVGIELSRNFGQIQAITAGLDYSKGDNPIYSRDTLDQIIGDTVTFDTINEVVASN